MSVTSNTPQRVKLSIPHPCTDTARTKHYKSVVPDAGASSPVATAAPGPTWPARDAAGAACELAFVFRAVSCSCSPRSIESASGAREAQRWAAPQPVDAAAGQRMERVSIKRPLGSSRGKTVDPSRRHRSRDTSLDQTAIGIVARENRRSITPLPELGHESRSSTCAHNPTRNVVVQERSRLR
jgi:hypothetical protein